MPTDLPDVTLAVVDSVACSLSFLAIRDTLQEITPAEVLIFSDKREEFREFGDWVVETPQIKSLAEAGEVIWYEIAALTRTSHVLLIQWDGWVLDGERWDKNWLAYDYIGAPWPWHTEHSVGNGGFSLRSTRLMKHLAINRRQYPHVVPEDDTICRAYRPELEEDGFCFAPQREALGFAFERTPPCPAFGFHGLQNLMKVLPPTLLDERIELANDYVRGKVEWRQMVDHA